MRTGASAEWRTDTGRTEIYRLWDEVKRFDNPHNYYVDLSPKLWKLKNDLLMAGGTLPKENA